MNLKGLLKHRNAIYGVLAIWIVLFHINRRLGNVMTVPVLSQIISCGNMGVDIFMLFSGCCLYLSLDKKPDVMTFYNRRFIRIIPAYLLITVPFWFWRSLIEAPMASGNFHFIRFFADLSSASFWFTGIETTWFVAAIVVFYLLFPMIYKIIKKGNEQTFILLAVTYALNIIAIEFIPLYNKSSIAWTRLPVFVIGAIFGKYIDSIDLERLDSKPRYILIGGGILSLILLIIVFPLGTLFTNENVQSEYLWLLYGPMAMIAVVLLMYFLRGKPGNSIYSKILRLVGEMSLEMYMTHIIILHWFTYYGLLENFRAWTFIIIFVLAFIWSYVASVVIQKKEKLKWG